MRIGSPGFIGERLREAREARGINGVALADLLGVSRQAVSQYEKGAVTPAPEVLARMAGLLNVPERFFSRPIERGAIGTLFYRSFASATKTARLRAERRYGWLKEIVHYLENFLELPDPDFPDAAANPLNLSDADIERIADDVRRHFGLASGPVPSMVVLLENNGGLVSRYEVGSDALDAFSEWAQPDHRPYFVLSSEKASAVRSRLDAAHELGHIVLHRHIPRELLLHKPTFDLIEAQAFRFAGAFLLPAHEFADDFFYPTVGELRRLKEKWGAAMSAIVKRCENLDLLPQSEITRLWIALSRWKKREPLDDEMEPEQPRVIRDSFEMLLAENVQTRQQVKDALPFSRHDIEALGGLPAGFLEEPVAAPVIELKPRAAISGTDGSGRIVPFPKK